MQNRLYGSAEEGLALLEEAARQFNQLAATNRRLRYLARDCAISIGNLLAAVGENASAIARYEEAIAGEHDYNRRAVGQLNIARTLVADGRIYQALRIVEKVKLQKLESKRLAQYFQLMRARILLLLGYERLCLDILAELSQPVDLQIGIERRYLELMAGIDFQVPANFLAGWEQFQQWLRLADCSGSVQEFYELEWMVYQCLITPGRIGNKEHFLARARHLGSKVNEKAIALFLRRLLPFINKKAKSDADFTAIIDALTSLTIGGNTRMAQVLVMLLGQVLVQQKQFRFLDQLLRSFRIWQETMESGLSKSLVAKLSTEKNSIRETYQELFLALPETMREVDARIEDVLLR